MKTSTVHMWHTCRRTVLPNKAGDCCTCRRSPTVWRGARFKAASRKREGVGSNAVGDAEIGLC